MAEPQVTANQWNVLRSGMFAFLGFSMGGAWCFTKMGSIAGTVGCLAFGGVGMAYCAIIAGRVALRRPEITPPNGSAENAVGKTRGQNHKKSAKTKSPTGSKTNSQGRSNTDIIERIALDGLVFDELYRDAESITSLDNDKKTTQLKQVSTTQNRDVNTKEITEYPYEIDKINTDSHSNHLYLFSQN